MTAAATGVLIFALGATVIAPDDPTPIRVAPVVSDTQVIVSFSAPEAIGPDVGTVVQSGLMLTLTFQVELKKPARSWFDRTLATVGVASTVKFDNLTGVYHVSRLRDGHIVWSERTSDFAQARGWATAFDGIVLAETTLLEPNADYDVRVSLRTSPRRTFPLWPWASDESTGRATFTFIR